MKPELAARRKESAKLAIRDRVSAGRQFHSRSLDISRQVNDAISPSLPVYVRQYLRGYADALLDGLSRETDFRYLINGTWIPAGDLEYGTECADPRTCEHPGHIAAMRNPPSALFWRGTDRVFYQSIEHIYGQVPA